MIPIVIPSSNRADRVLTKIKDMILCVPEDQEQDYRRFNPNTEIITHPEINGLAMKRNWIIQQYDDVFMVDDDIQYIERVYTRENRFMSPQEANNTIQDLYQKAIALDAHLFGFSEDANPLHYNQYKPIVLKGYINGCAFGIRKSDKLYFTDTVVAVEDYWINLLNLYHHRYPLIDTRFCFAQKPNSTFSSSGGLALHRTMETEKRDTLYLRATFGEVVEIKKIKPGAKKFHQYQRKIKWPW